MTRLLLSLALLAAQLASWNASPRYLCRGEDGTTCVDLGPATCDCCHHEALALAPAAEACGAHDEHGACPDHDHGDRNAPVVFDPCGCLHVQLSEAQQATLDRAAATPDSHRLLNTLFPVGHGEGAACCATMSDFHSGHDFSSCCETLAERSGVVMRC